ncbi:MAG: response regulator [Anaerolineales bacterium]|nr:response regulator [Anaerolineales bacterium]
MTDPLALIIEDEEDLAVIFAEALKSAGFATEIIDNGIAAVERLAQTTPKVIVLDLHLPGLDGGKVLRQIRADERLKETRVLIASADAAFARTLEKHADLVLLKPISFSQLRDLARRLAGFPPANTQG